MTGARKGENVQELEDSFKAVLHCASSDDDDWVKLTGSLMSDIVSANRIRLDMKEIDEIGASLSSMLSTSEAKSSLKGITSLQRRFLSAGNPALDLSDENWKVSNIETSHCVRPEAFHEKFKKKGLFDIKPQTKDEMKDREAREHSFSVSGLNAAFPKAMTPKHRTESNWWEGTQRTTSAEIIRPERRVLVEEVDEENENANDAPEQAPAGKRSRGKKNQNDEEGGKQKKHKANDAASANVEQAAMREDASASKIEAEQGAEAPAADVPPPAPAVESVAQWKKQLKTVPGLLEIIETSRHVMEGEKRVIIDFIRGVRVNPFPGQPPAMTFVLRSERLEGKVESILLEINYETGSWKVHRNSSEDNG
uniref:Uncharacterized protein n=1 Tax=Hanusia phi TaxID=3032 RepID=A0A7S0E702_9CRYP